MTEEPEKVDLVLRWKDEDVKGRAASLDEAIEDLFEGERPAADDAEVQGVAIDPIEVAERFQYTHERDAAIEAALRQMSDIPSPRVHAQLEKICDALEARTLGGDPATGLLDEVDAYLGEQIARRQRLPAVADALLQAARSSVLDGLTLYADVVRLLRDHLSTGSPTELILARRLIEQAAGFLLNARDALIQAQPELPAEEPEEESGS